MQARSPGRPSAASPEIFRRTAPGKGASGPETCPRFRAVSAHFCRLAPCRPRVAACFRPPRKMSQKRGRFTGEGRGCKVAWAKSSRERCPATARCSSPGRPRAASRPLANGHRPRPAAGASFNADALPGYSRNGGSLTARPLTFGRSPRAAPASTARSARSGLGSVGSMAQGRPPRLHRRPPTRRRRAARGSTSPR